MDTTGQAASRAGAAIILAFLVSACGVVDSMSPRVTTFNGQAANAGAKTILTNIIRAAYAEPLQFTALTSASGQASINGGLSAAIPFPFRGGEGTPLPRQVINGNLSSQMSAGNTFTINNQNTQEFYQGIQTPVSQTALYSLMSEGYDPRIVLNLFVSDIILTGPKGTVVLRNDPLDYGQWSNFYSAVNQLVGNGIDGERISDVAPIGPAISPGEVRDPRVLSALITAPSGAPSLTPENGGYRLTRREAGFRFCFRTNTERIILAYRGFPKPDPAQTISLNTGDRCGAPAAHRAIPNLGVKVSFRTRSVKAAILYLGALVRVQVGLAGASVRPVVVPHSDGSTFHVFRVRKGGETSSWISVRHRGEVYSIASDPTGSSDGSTRVMQLLTDVLALQSSAKDAPSTSIISIL